MTRRRTLTEQQISDIRKWRQLGRTRKEIARLVGCTPNQARHYSDDVPKDAAIRSILLRTPRLSPDLAREVAEASAAPSAPFKPGDLTW